MKGCLVCKQYAGPAVLSCTETFLSIRGRVRFCSTDVNVAFQRAAHKVLLDDDNLLPLLHLTVDYQGKDKGETAAAAAL